MCVLLQQGESGGAEATMIPCLRQITGQAGNPIFLPDNLQRRRHESREPKPVHQERTRTLHYSLTRLKNGAVRYQALVYLDHHWQTCDHRHRFYDLAMTCSRRWAQRLRIDSN